ncbi:unnamed protein product [Moneuplotes crassus]|uniref:FAD-binding FR-type domain-containing protein n=1 Tax=Euplotes crassus TaxID=5936 RepID=A0AAD2D1R2_EUPCR|nr:unnamed protein product [Moneuplotes crassus]
MFSKNKRPQQAKSMDNIDQNLIGVHKFTIEDPDVYIKRAFGKNFEFSEEFLLSHIEPKVVLKAIQKRYRFKKITRVTIKHILYEGARSNNILRINDESYEKLVDILELPIDEEIMETPNRRRREFLKFRQSPELNRLSPVLFQNSTNKKLPTIQESVIGTSQVCAKSSQIQKSEHSLLELSRSTMNSEDYIQQSYNDLFEQAKNLLTNIIRTEKGNMALIKPLRHPKKNTISPINFEDRSTEQYIHDKVQYRELLCKLMSTRAAFSQKMKVDIQSSLHTVQEIQQTSSNYMGDTGSCTQKQSSSSRCKSLIPDFRRPQYSLFLIILLISIIFGLIFGGIIYLTHHYEVAGYGLISSKMFGSACILLISLLCLFISIDLITWFRSKFKGKCLSLLDHNLAIHKFCGHLMVIYAIFHSLSHLFGTFRHISNADYDKLRENKRFRDRFDHTPTYSELLFQTYPGITGLLLLVVTITIGITSLKCIRQKRFQIFGYTHMVLFPIFLLLFCIHGLDTWFIVGTPIAIIIITPKFVLLIFQRIARVTSGCRYTFQIADVSMSFSCKYIMIHLTKPKGYKLVHGQFIYINVPEVNLFQWHPFTVASSPDNPYLVLMIKKAGNWTTKLSNLLYERKKKMMKFDELNFMDYEEYDVFNLLHDLHQEIPLKEVNERNKIYYPKVNISWACATPNEAFIDQKNIILVGAGSGISPYLCLLEEVIRFDQGKNNKYDFETARLIFVAREGEQVSWISNYLFHIINSKCVMPSLEFYVFITIDKELETLPSFLFWRAFMLIQSQKDICIRERKNSKSKSKSKSKPKANPNLSLGLKSSTNNDDEEIKRRIQKSPIRVMFGRPDFKSLFKSFITPNSKEFHCYSTTSPVVNRAIFDAAYKVTKETKVKFHHIYEATS